MSRKWEEEAAYYDAHRNDPNEWGDPVEAPIAAPKDGLAISVTVRFAPQDAEAIRRTAQRESKTYSDVVRTAVQRYTKPDTVFQGNRENVVPVFESQAPRTQPSPLRDAFAFDHPPTGSRTLSSVAAARAAGRISTSRCD